MAGVKSDAAWRRALEAPGARDEIGTLGGRPAIRASFANVELMWLQFQVEEREAREDQQRVARVLRRWERDLAQLRKALRRVPLSTMMGSSGTGDRPEERTRFFEAAHALFKALETALAAIPPTARLDWKPDELDAAPTRARLPRVAAEKAAALGWPTSGKALLDLMESQGLAVRDQGARDRWGMQGHRVRKGRHPVAAKPRKRRRNTSRRA
jgi:hypothetical protein